MPNGTGRTLSAYITCREKKGVLWMKKWKVRLAVVLTACMVSGSVPAWYGEGTPVTGKKYFGMIAYASSSDAERESDVSNDQDQEEEYRTASSSDAVEDELVNDVMLMTAGGETRAEVGSGEADSYESLAEVFEALGSDTGVLTIELKGDTNDQNRVVVPVDKGIEKVIIQGDDDYVIGVGDPADVIANGIPMVFEAGTVRSVVGGGFNSKVVSTDLTVTGGHFLYCVGGGLATEPGADARVTKTVKLKFENAQLDDPDGEYNQIYTSGELSGNCIGADVSAGAARLEIIDSYLDFDMIMGGSYVEAKDTKAALGRSDIIISNSTVVLGDGLCGAHAVNGLLDGPQLATCGPVNIEIYDSTIEGDVLGGSVVTSDGIMDIGSIRIYAENSNMASVQAGGVYMGHFDFSIESIDVTLDSCTINGSHWFKEEYSIVGAGCYVGEEKKNPEDDLHVTIGSASYTFLNSVLDDPVDEGVEGLLFQPEGYLEGGSAVAFGKTELKLSADTDFIVDVGDLDHFTLEPPEGYRFTTAQIDGEEISRDDMDVAVIDGLMTGSTVTASLEAVEMKDQPPVEILEAAGGTVKKTIGEPDFALTVTGGEETLKPHYKSSDPSVAEVDENGLVTMKKPGKTVITVVKQSVEYRKRSAELKLTVEEAAATIIPEEQPEDSGYVLVAKKVTTEIRETIDREVEKRPEFDSEVTLLPMEIILLDRSTGEEALGQGSTFTIAYPVAEMKENPNRYDVHILHIPSSGAPYMVPFEMTESGIRISVDNFSPFVMGYKKMAEPEPEEPEIPPVNPPDIPPVNPPASASSSENDDGGDLSGKWIEDTSGWWYLYSNDTYPSGGWAYLPYRGSYNWYFFNKAGYMRTGWLEWNGSRYYLHEKSDGRRGSMETGWSEIDGKRYYFEEKRGKEEGKMR